MVRTMTVFFQALHHIYSKRKQIPECLYFQYSKHLLAVAAEKYAYRVSFESFQEQISSQRYLNFIRFSWYFDVSPKWMQGLVRIKLIYPEFFHIIFKSLIANYRNTRTVLPQILIAKLNEQ
jgi:hypothetical protein